MKDIIRTKFKFWETSSILKYNEPYIVSPHTYAIRGMLYGVWWDFKFVQKIANIKYEGYYKNKIYVLRNPFDFEISGLGSLKYVFLHMLLLHSRSNIKKLRCRIRFETGIFGQQFCNSESLVASKTAN